MNQSFAPTASIRLTQTFMPTGITTVSGNFRRSTRYTSCLESSLFHDDSGDLLFTNYKPIKLANVFKPSQKFCTGTEYNGEWDGHGLGFSGNGTYKYCHGVKYEGGFKNGEFSGRGVLIYPNGFRFEGMWKDGRLVGDPNIFNGEGTILEDTEYCKMPDRRFQIEIEMYFNPAGQEFLTNSSPPRSIPMQCVDTGIGYYNPWTKVLTQYANPGKRMKDGMRSLNKLVKFITMLDDEENEEAYVTRIRRWNATDVENTQSPNETTEKWIMDNCRKQWDEPTGYRPDFYEEWNAGRSFEQKRESTRIDHREGRMRSELPELFEFDKNTKQILEKRSTLTDDEDTVTLMETVSSRWLMHLKPKDPNVTKSSIGISKLSTIFGMKTDTAVESDADEKPFVGNMLRVSRIHVAEDDKLPENKVCKRSERGTVQCFNLDEIDEVITKVKEETMSIVSDTGTIVKTNLDAFTLPSRTGQRTVGTIDESTPLPLRDGKTSILKPSKERTEEESETDITQPRVGSSLVVRKLGSSIDLKDLHRKSREFSSVWIPPSDSIIMDVPKSPVKRKFEQENEERQTEVIHYPKNANKDTDSGSSKYSDDMNIEQHTSAYEIVTESPVGKLQVPIKRKFSDTTQSSGDESFDFEKRKMPGRSILKGNRKKRDSDVSDERVNRKRKHSRE